MTGSARTLLAAAVLLGPACGSDGAIFAPTLVTVAGSYEATTLTGTQSGITTDFLALGASLSLVLNLDGTTSGRLLAPGLGENGEDVDEDLTGTWALSGSTVTFSLSPAADNFLPDLPFTAELNRLTAEGTFGSGTLRIILTK